VDLRRLSALVLAVGCGGGPEPRAGDPELVRAAQDIFGRGDGPAGRGLFPPPRDFTDPAWQASVDDARLRRVIVEGGASVGLSSHMLPNTDLADSPVLVGEIVAIVRSLSSGTGAPVTSSRAP
jgi:hypothetical protein